MSIIIQEMQYYIKPRTHEWVPIWVWVPTHNLKHKVLAIC